MSAEPATTRLFTERVYGAQRILIVAPHPDDESLGCGGLIATLASIGRTFHFLFVTDGGASHRGSRKWGRDRLIQQRRKEAEAALAILGAGNQTRTFLGLPDAAMPRSGTAAWHAALMEVTLLVSAFQPDLAILPWRRDPHCDHRDSWSLVTEAIQRSELPLPPSALEYAIWLDELGDTDDFPHQGEAVPIHFDIADAVNVKAEAVAAHLSQATDLIDDDPQAFRLTLKTIRRLTGSRERYWRVLE